MRTLVLLIAACFLLSVGEARAAGTAAPSLADLRKVTDGVMAKVGSGDIEGGLRAIRPYTIIPSAEFEVMLSQVPAQLPGISARFGASIGQEFIREEKLGESVARIVYIHKFEKHPMRWMFFAYKGKSGWVINTFRFDDKWHELFPAQ